MPAKKGIWEYVFANVKAIASRVRYFIRGTTTTTVTEVQYPAEFSEIVTTSSTGSYTWDYTPMAFLEIYTVQATPVATTAAPANALQVELVGDPTVTKATIQVMKPNSIVLGGNPVAAAGAVKVHMLVRGRIAAPAS